MATYVGLTAALVDASEFGDTAIELMVADAGHVEADSCRDVDRRLVIEERRKKRRCADQVTRGDKDVVGVLGAQAVQQRGHRAHTAGRHVDAALRVGRVGDADAAGRRLQVAVEVVDGQHLDMHGLGQWQGAAGGQQTYEEQHGRLGHAVQERHRLISSARRCPARSPRP